MRRKDLIEEPDVRKERREARQARKKPGKYAAKIELILGAIVVAGVLLVLLYQACR